MDLMAILHAAAKHGASDIHIVVGKPPMVRIDGELTSMGKEVLDATECERLVYAILNAKQKSQFEETQELDCSIGVDGLGRFRVNALQHKNGMGAVLRVIQGNPPNPEDIGLSEPIIRLSELPRGLILVTGPTGSGKSTTLAALIERLNRTKRHHILTVEDPIEFVYESQLSVITQREVSTHTQSFAAALKSALRQDPDVILVGEMRDLETIALAISAAETGHLVFATLHTTDAAQTVDRIVDVFPAYQQEQIRMQLSTGLRGVICQQLLKKKGGGRIAAREILIVNPAVANLIREGKTHQIYSAVELGRKFGMQSLDRHLAELVLHRKVELDEAVAKANDPKNFKMILEGLVAQAQAEAAEQGGGRRGRRR
jgi:twitching motility protein PilT